MAEPWARAFHARRQRFLGVDGLGFGPPESQAANAKQFLFNAQDQGVLESTEDLILVGQSVGGLVARVLATDRDLRPRVRAVFTVGSPHFGAEPADRAADFPDRHPALTRFTALLGYDPRTRVGPAWHFSSEALADFNRRFPVSKDLSTPPLYSLVCVAGHHNTNFYLSFTRKVMGLREHGDGFIALKSQSLGRVFGPFEIDHLSAHGFFFSATKRRRRAAEAEFNRIVDTIVSETERLLSTSAQDHHLSANRVPK
jgi:pimeloyl-ACP methyl ester carboxylesterase